jgi:hypothetical protein
MGVRCATRAIVCILQVERRASRAAICDREAQPGVSITPRKKPKASQVQRRRPENQRSRPLFTAPMRRACIEAGRGYDPTLPNKSPPISFQGEPFGCRHKTSTLASLRSPIDEIEDGKRASL